MRLYLIAMLLVVCVSVPAFAERITLDKPVRVAAQKADHTRFAGGVVSYDQRDFELLDYGGHKQQVRWDELDARTCYQVRASLLSPRDAQGFLELGAALLKFDKGKDWADRAFDRAVRIDPSLRAKVIEARRAASEGPAQPSDSDSSHPGPVLSAGPRLSGQVQERFWGTLSDAQQVEAIKRLTSFGAEVGQKLKVPLQLYETRYFLFYSDLNANEAVKWAGLLDRMYVYLGGLFGVQKDENIWHGKAVIFVFSRKAGYDRYEQEIEHTDPAQTAGRCHMFGDGSVHIAFYRQSDEIFAHVLVHESVHGFLFRYRSPRNVPSWANEGLAETIATIICQPTVQDQAIHSRAREQITAHGNYLGDFFQAKQIAGWQYPVAQSLTTFMIRQSKSNYVEFINGLKDGLEWKEALAEKYKAPIERLLRVYGAVLGLRTLDAEF